VIQERNNMSNMKPIGKWIVAKALIGGEKTTAAGIIFQEKSKSRIIPAKVLSVGNKLTEDIKVGDIIWWDVGKIKDGYNGDHVIHQDWVEMVERT
jgi:co-chaperonin GroES (HSP10)